MKTQRQLGKRLARKLPEPKVVNHNGVNVVTQQVEGLAQDELLALSDYYRWRYGDKGTS